MTHADLAGWTAAALMVSTFASRDARVMRPLAVSTNLAFIAYGALAALPPVLALHLLLLPINAWRWAQARHLEFRELRMITVRFLRVLGIALLVLPLLAACGRATGGVLGGLRTIALQGDGKLVLAGQASTSAVSHLRIARLLPDGTPDAGFGTNGVLLVDFFGALDSANDLLVQPDGKLLGGGLARNGLAAAPALVRILP